jgi:predicted transcriptional regulator
MAFAKPDRDDVRTRRIALGLTQLDLAAKAPCHNSLVSQVEAGYRPSRSKGYARLVATLERLEREQDGGAPA